MKRLRTFAVLTVIVGLVAFAPRGLDAQNAPKRPFSLEDMLQFRALGLTQLSPNGQWLAYRLSPLEGDTELILRQTQGDQEMKFPVGQGGGTLMFSDDSAWAVITISPTRRESQANTRARRPNQNSVTIVNLASGEKTTIANIRRAAFNGEMSNWIALDRYPPTGAAGAAGPALPAPGGPPVPPPPGGGRGGAEPPRSTAPRGGNIVLRDLKTGTELLLGNVFQWAFNKSGRYLALLIDAPDQVGNGIQIRDMQTGAITPLETEKAFYEGMSWTREGDALAFFKGKDDRQWRERLFAAVGYTGVGGSSQKRVLYDPAEDKTFPAGYGISANRALTWTESRDALIFGIAPLTKVPPPAGRGAGAGAAGAPPATGEPPAEGGGRAAGAGDDTTAERPNLVIWHYKDPRLQSQQEVQEAADRRFNYVSVYRPGENKMIRLADEEVPDLVVNGRTRWAIGTNDDPYELMGNLDGRRFVDVFAVDTHTGQRKTVKQNLRWGNQASPDGMKYLFYENKHFHVYDIATGATANITAKVPTSFVNVEDDHNIVDPPTTVVGWTADNANVLISDRWDVWKVPVAGGAPVNLTLNGKKDQIRYQGRLRIDPEERGIDLTKPQYFAIMHELTKKSGYALLEPGSTTGLKVLLMEDAGISQLTKAEKADVWIYRRETPTQATQVFVTSSTLANGRKIVDTAKEADPYLWSSGAQLLSYTNAHPNPKERVQLQASLYLPANYEKGKQYPLMVYIYERLTQGHNQYGRPTTNGFSRQAYTSNGYAVLQPDIKYYINDPGMSAVWAVVPAVQAAIKTGIVDPKHVGITGHSWGGYQTAHLVTQTDIFAAAIAGAPLTNMISMYSIIYKNSGGTNGAIFESSQGRFTGGPWEQWEAYTRNSPVAHATKVKTPLIILHNDLDGAVDFTQGVEYYNTLRRLQKPVIMLEYPGENHGLARPANQQDYTIRMREFFDHYLKGAPAPDWLQYGVPRLKMQEHIDQRLKEREKEKAPPPPGTTGRGGGGH
jgi:dipeptidyl aminopeptidase/acylaminoacyl peptidase